MKQRALRVTHIWLTAALVVGSLVASPRSSAHADVLADATLGRLVAIPPDSAFLVADLWDPTADRLYVVVSWHDGTDHVLVHGGWEEWRVDGSSLLSVAPDLEAASVDADIPGLGRLVLSTRIGGDNQALGGCATTPVFEARFASPTTQIRDSDGGGPQVWGSIDGRTVYRPTCGAYGLGGSGVVAVGLI